MLNEFGVAFGTGDGNFPFASGNSYFLAAFGALVDVVSFSLLAHVLLSAEEGGYTAAPGKVGLIFPVALRVVL